MIGLVKPIYMYKNKGDPTKPDNFALLNIFYCVTLLSCLGKVFTCIFLNRRLETFANEINLLKENQASFRKIYSTLDHVLTLQFLSNILSQRKKKIIWCLC